MATLKISFTPLGWLSAVAALDLHIQTCNRTDSGTAGQIAVEFSWVADGYTRRTIPFSLGEAGKDFEADSNKTYTVCINECPALLKSVKFSISGSNKHDGWCLLTFYVDGVQWLTPKDDGYEEWWFDNPCEWAVSGNVRYMYPYQHVDQDHCAITQEFFNTNYKSPTPAPSPATQPAPATSPATQPAPSPTNGTTPATLLGAPASAAVPGPSPQAQPNEPSPSSGIANSAVTMSSVTAFALTAVAMAGQCPNDGAISELH